MELWELNVCVREYNRIKQESAFSEITASWRTANFTGAAFAGKLRKLDYYMKNSETKQAPKVSVNEFEEKLKLAERSVKNGSS